eukprot:scaffold59233_cov27-Tisochrysis_lutea.AAC.1
MYACMLLACVSSCALVCPRVHLRAPAMCVYSQGRSGVLSSSGLSPTGPRVLNAQAILEGEERGFFGGRQAVPEMKGKHAAEGSQFERLG